MKTTFYSTSIRCGGCAANVRAVVGKVDGVRAVEVDPATKRVEIDFDDARTSVEALSGRLAEAGYPVGEPPRSAS